MKRLQLFFQISPRKSLFKLIIEVTKSPTSYGPSHLAPEGTCHMVTRGKIQRYKETYSHSQKKLEN